MRKKSLITAIFVATLCAAQNLSAEQRYEFIVEFEKNTYIEKANDVKDSSQISDIRRSILQDQNLSKEEKVNLIKQIGEIQIAKIDKEANIEKACIYLEAALSAAVRTANYLVVTKTGNAYLVGAVDGIADDLLNGKCREAIVRCVKEGDTSGLMKVCGDVLVNAGLGKLLSSEVVGPLLDKCPVYKTLKNKATDVLNPIPKLQTLYSKISKDISKYGDDSAWLSHDLYNTVKPKLDGYKAEIANLYRELNKAKTEEAAATIRSRLKIMETERDALQTTFDNGVARLNLLCETIGNLESQLARVVRLENLTSSAFAITDSAIQKSILDRVKVPFAELTVNESIELAVSSTVDFMIDTNKKITEAENRLINAAAEEALNGGIQLLERAYETKSRELDVQLNTGNILLTGGVEENVYVDNSTGEIIKIEDGEIPANILNTTFADNPAESKDAQTLANEAFNKEIDKIVKDVADGDQSLADKMKDFVKGKIEEAIKKGEDWIENGGIRDTLKDQIGKMLDGKVSDADKQRIMNLTDGLCNVGKDGGKTLVEALGNDGVPLAASLALNELKKQIASALPAEDAAHVNALIDTLNSGATTAEKRALMLAELQKLVSEKIPYENSAKAVNDIIQTIADGKAVDVLDSVKNVGNAIAIEALKDVISKSLDPETAAKLNALLDGYAANGIKGLDDALMAQIDALIDKAAPGKDSAEKLKKVYHGLKDGTITAKDVKDAATATVADGAKALIDKSNLPDAVKEAAKAAIDGLAEDGLTGLTKNMEEYIHSQVEAALGKDAADAVTDIIDAVVTPGKDPWEAIEKNADKIGEAIKEKIFKEVENLAEKQLNKLIDKFPALKNVLGNLGIDAKGIIQGIKNIFGVLANAPDLTTAISQLSQMAASFLKDIAAKLIDWALEWAVSWLNDFLIPKVMDWTSSTLDKWASSTGNPRIKAGLEWLQSQVSNCKKCARIKIKTKGTGAKVISKIDAMIEKKKKSGEKVLEGSTKR